MATFDAVILEGSLSNAAKRLGVSQSAISQSIARLRDVLKDDLFEGTGRGMRPTPRARELEQPIRRALVLIDQALRASPDFDPLTSDRVFRIGMRPDLAHFSAPRVLARRPKGSPLRFQIEQRRANGVVADLRYGTPELLVDGEPVRGVGYHAELVSEALPVVLARKGHPTLKPRLTLDAYLGVEHAVLSRSGPGDASAVTEELRKRGHTRRIAIALPAAPSVVMLVAESDLICTVPEPFANEAVERLGLEIHRLPFDIAPLPTFMSWHERYDEDPGHRWLREQIKAICRGA